MIFVRGLSRTGGRLCAAAVAALAASILVVGTGSAASAAADTTAPTMPGNFRVTAVTHTSVSLAWTRSTDNVGVASYTLWVDGVLGARAVPATQTTATWSDLRPGQTYTVRIRAYDAQFNGSPTSSLTVTTRPDTTAPSAPTGLQVKSVVGSRVLLSWNAGSDDLGTPRGEILVNGVPSGDTISTTAVGSPTPWSIQSAWVRQLEPGTTYTFTVRAVDASGNRSAASNPVRATTEPSADATAPTTPALLSARVGGGGNCPEELWLRWARSSDDTDAATAIEYEVRVNGAIMEVATGAAGSITYSDVLGANRVTIVAVDRAGNASAPSNAITVTTNWGQGQDCPA